MQMVSWRRADIGVRVESMRMPGAVDLCGMQSPDEVLFGEVESKETVETGARQVQLALVLADFMAVLQVSISE